MNTQHFSIPTDDEFNDLAATFGGSPAPAHQLEIEANSFSVPPEASNVGPLAQSDDLAEGLTQQIDLAQQVAIDEDCGTIWTHNYDKNADYAARLIRCGHCDECLQWKATQTEKRVLRRLEIRKDGNDNLVTSTLSVPKIKVLALQKRLQRDETAQYYRAQNKAGDFDFVIQSEKVYGEVVETLEYDFALAAKISKAKGKRQTGLLYSLKSKKVTDKGEDTYPFSLTRITAKKQGDSKRITVIAKTIKPDKHVYDKKEHQVGIFALTSRLLGALDEAGIGYTTEGFSVRAGPINRDRYNAKVVECPNKSPIEIDTSIGVLFGQNSLLDEPEAQSEPIIWQFETTQYEDAQRQIELIGYPAN